MQEARTKQMAARMLGLRLRGSMKGQLHFALKQISLSAQATNRLILGLGNLRHFVAAKIMGLLSAFALRTAMRHSRARGVHLLVKTIFNVMAKETRDIKRTVICQLQDLLTSDTLRAAIACRAKGLSMIERVLTSRVQAMYKTLRANQPRKSLIVANLLMLRNILQRKLQGSLYVLVKSVTHTHSHVYKQKVQTLEQMAQLLYKRQRRSLKEALQLIRAKGNSGARARQALSRVLVHKYKRTVKVSLHSWKREVWRMRQKTAQIALGMQVLATFTKMREALLKKTALEAIKSHCLRSNRKVLQVVRFCKILHKVFYGSSALADSFARLQAFPHQSILSSIQRLSHTIKQSA